MVNNLEIIDVKNIVMPYSDMAKKLNPVKANLYGLDIIINKDGEYFINEINGCQSGMKGFKQVYGDNRVEKEVHNRLSALGDLVVHDGSFKVKQEDRDLRELLRRGIVWYGNYLLDLNDWFFKWRHRKLSKKELNDVMRFRYLKSHVKYHNLVSEKLDIDWLFEDLPESGASEIILKKYNGQPSLVMNFTEDYLAHPTVNSFVEEHIADNKFLQYQLMKNEKLPMALPKTTLVGLGVGDRSALEEMIEKYDRFVKKPVSGRCGVGVVFIHNDQVRKYVDQIGPIREPSMTEAVLGVPLHVEDLVAKKKYGFEISMHVIQPFIDSKGVGKNGSYATIRAIVCNGEFVDAYMRYSQNPRVNLTQGAGAAAFKDVKLKGYCEEVVRAYNKRCADLSPYNFRSKLYQEWFDEVNGTNAQHSVFEELISTLISVYTNKV